MPRKPLTPEHVQAVLLAVGLMCPEAQFNDEPENRARVTLIVAQFHEDCMHVGMDAQEFSKAVKECRRRRGSFPRIADVLRAHRELREAAYEPPPLSLPAHDTQAEMEAQLKRNIEGCARMKALLAKVGEGKRVTQ